MDDIPNLTWLNVGLASLFILINAGISLYLKLKLEKALLISSVRCIVQLTIMGKILNDVFEANNVYLVMLMTFTLIFLSSCETVYNKSEWSFNGMFPSVLITTAFTTMLIGIIGSRYAMNEKTFWAPDLFIPTMGLILGVTAGGVAVSLSICLDKIKEDQKVIETYLSYGASKWEACRMIAKESIKLALLPNINRMSIVGLITIPGAMTGQILSGAPIMNAVYYQQIITFMISAAETLCVVIVTYVAIYYVIDSKDRLRPERVHKREATVWNDIKYIARRLCCQKDPLSLFLQATILSVLSLLIICCSSSLLSITHSNNKLMPSNSHIMLHSPCLTRQDAFMVESGDYCTPLDEMPSIIPICRFCLMEMIKPITHEFMKTCSCPSQYSYVHEQCFKNWLLSTEIPPTTCSLCGTDYPKRFYPHTPFKRPIVNILLKVLWCILLHVTLQCAQCFKSRLYEREEMLRIDDSLTNVPEWLVVPTITGQCVYQKCSSISQIGISLVMISLLYVYSLIDRYSLFKR